MIWNCRALLLVFVAAAVAARGNGAAPEAKESRDAVIHFIPFSHLDLYWGGTREECLARGNQIIAKALGKSCVCWGLALRPHKFGVEIYSNVPFNRAKRYSYTLETVPVLYPLEHAKIQVRPHVENTLLAIVKDESKGIVVVRNDLNHRGVHVFRLLTEAAES